MSVTVDAVMYCRIIDPVASTTKVVDVAAASKLLGATTLRNVLGTKTMTEILSQRDEINAVMKVRSFLKLTDYCDWHTDTFVTCIQTHTNFTYLSRHMHAC